MAPIDISCSDATLSGYKLTSAHKSSIFPDLACVYTPMSRAELLDCLITLSQGTMTRLMENWVLTYRYLLSGISDITAFYWRFYILEYNRLKWLPEGVVWEPRPQAKSKTNWTFSIWNKSWKVAFEQDLSIDAIFSGKNVKHIQMYPLSEAHPSEHVVA